MEEKESKKSNKIEIVKGHSKDLEISEVKDNLTFEVSKNNTTNKGNIIIPKNHKKN